jgi:2-phospho-L-lactate guanylyltransferase
VKVSEVVLVTPQPREVDPSISVVIDAAQGLSRAFEAGCQYAAARGHCEAMLLPADLPLLTVSDLEAMIEAGRRSGAALASDRAGAGTNGLYLPLPLPFSLAYGKGSSLLHAAACGHAGLVMSLLERPGLSFDVDSPSDLEGLAGYADFTFLSERERTVEC